MDEFEIIRRCFSRAPSDESVLIGVGDDGQTYNINADTSAGALASALKPQKLIMLTDVERVFTDFGTDRQRAIIAAHPDALEELEFDAGSMGPKVQGACRFVRETGRRSAIGRLRELTGIVEGHAGTLISNEIDGIEFSD